MTRWWDVKENNISIYNNIEKINSMYIGRCRSLGAQSVKYKISSIALVKPTRYTLVQPLASTPYTSFQLLMVLSMCKLICIIIAYPEASVQRTCLF